LPSRRSVKAARFSFCHRGLSAIGAPAAGVVAHALMRASTEPAARELHARSAQEKI